MKEEAYISYSWSGRRKTGVIHTPIVDAVAKQLKKNFKVRIDQKDLRYKGDIKKFETQLGKGGKIVLIICDKFLKSKHCMFEILNIKENGNVYERIFPIVLDDATIHNAKGRLNYLKHWEQEKKDLEKELRELESSSNTQSIQDEINNYTKFREIIDEITSLLSNMNTLDAKTHQETNFKELLVSMGGKKKEDKSSKDFGVKMTKIKKLFEDSISLVENEIENSNVKAEDLLNLFKYYQKKCQDQTFQIAVMAMVKSGKSTFLNALLGDELLPMSNKPETAIPIKIVHSNSNEPILMNGSKKTGSQTIRSFIEKKNEEHRDIGSDIIEYSLHANIQALSSKKMNDVKFEIIDAPGFGEALKEVSIGRSIDDSTTDLLEKISAIIYILDYTKLKTKDENIALHRLAYLRQDILEKIQDRLFFIVNKVDLEDRNSLDPDETIEFIYGPLVKLMPKLRKEQFFQLSANTALLSRLIINGKATKQAKQDFEKLAFGKMSKGATDELCKENAPALLELSKICKIEDEVINFIYNNRGRLFIETLLDNLSRLLKDFRNKFVITAEGALNSTVEKIVELENKIQEAKKKQTSIELEAEKFEKEIRNRIESEFKIFEKNVNDNINAIFQPEQIEERQNWSSIPNLIRNLQNKVKEIFSESTSNSKFDIEQKVKQLNDEMHTHLYKQFTAFRKELEIKIFDRQKELLGSLQNTINNLAREFEGTVKSTFNINFESTEIKLDLLDFDRILMDADALLERFITKDAKLGYELQPKQVKTDGFLCWEGRYITQMVNTPVLKHEYSISKSTVKSFWKSRIEALNNNAKKVTNHLIDSQIKLQIKGAKSSFDDYVGHYMSSILDQKSRLSKGDPEAIKAKLDSLKLIGAQIQQMLAKIDLIR